MLKHVVAWQLKEENKEENLQKMKAMLEALVGKIDVIRSLMFGINENGGEYDAVLLVDFDNEADLKTYDTHPEHMEVRKFIRGVIESRMSADFNY